MSPGEIIKMVHKEDRKVFWSCGVCICRKQGWTVENDVPFNSLLSYGERAKNQENPWRPEYDPHPTLPTTTYLIAWQAGNCACQCWWLALLPETLKSCSLIP